MALILMIIQIISAIPAIITLIKDIISVIHGLNGPEKKAAEADLKAIIKKHLTGHDPSGCEKELVDLHQNLMDKYH